MNLLLTSAGITNPSIREALAGLCGKPFSECRAVFVPTAANTLAEDKGWLIDNLNQIRELGLKELDIIDISAVSKKYAFDRFKHANILVFGGGSTYHLMTWMEKLFLREELDKLLRLKVYVGISAGSMVASKDLVLSDTRKLYSEFAGNADRMDGLGLVDFHVRPHYRSPDFPKVTPAALKEIARRLSEPLYALDDNSAVVVSGGDIRVVSEGEWEKF